MVLKESKEKNGPLVIIECDGKKIGIGTFLKITTTVGSPFYGVVARMNIFDKGRRIRCCDVWLEGSNNGRGVLLHLRPCDKSERITVLTAQSIAQEMNDFQHRFAVLRAQVKDAIRKANEALEG